MSDDIKSSIAEYVSISHQIDELSKKLRKLKEMRKRHETNISAYMDRERIGVVSTSNGYSIELKVKEQKSAMTKAVFTEYFASKQMDPDASYTELKSFCPVVKKHELKLVSDS